jgi:hypothetical protein
MLKRDYNPLGIALRELFEGCLELFEIRNVQVSLDNNDRETEISSDFNHGRLP